MRVALLLDACDKHFIEAFERHGIEFEYFHNVIAGLINAGIAENKQDPLGMAEHKPDFGFQEL